MLQKLIKGAITIGTLLSLGFLSFAGTLLMNPHWLKQTPVTWGIVAFMFATIIEILVIAQNINGAWKKWRNFGDNYLKAALRTSILEEMAKEAAEKRARGEENAQEAIDAGLLGYYDNKQRFKQLHRQEDRLEPIDWIEEFFARRALHREKHRLEREIRAQEKNLIKKYGLASKPTPAVPASEDQRSTYQKASDSFAAEFKKRSSRPWIAFIQTAALIAGASAFFTTLAVLQKALPHLNELGLAISGVYCWPIAAFASIGFYLMSYNNLAQLVHNRVFSRTPASKSSTTTLLATVKKLPYYLFARVIPILAALFISVVLFSTWLNLGTSIINLGSHLGTYAFIGSITGVAVVVSLIWNITNTLRTIHLIENFLKKGGLKKLWQKCKETVVKARYLNLFFWLEKLSKYLFRLLVLIIHSFSVGLGGDDLKDVLPVIVAGTSGTVEFMTDGGYVFQVDESEDLPTLEYQAVPSESPEQALYQVKELPEDEHSHFDLAGIALIFILIPIKIARAVLDVLWCLARKSLGFSNKSWSASICEPIREIFSNPEAYLRDMPPHGPAPMPKGEWQSRPSTPAESSDAVGQPEIKVIEETTTLKLKTA
jgi:hypothetical protein